MAYPKALSATACTLAFVILGACGSDSNPLGTGGKSDLERGDGGGSNPSDVNPTGTIEACGSSATKCVAPSGGAVECVDGTCQPHCSDGDVLCGDACVDLSSTALHCGACNHSCGGGQCSTGVCQSFAVAKGFGVVHGFALAPNGVFISADSDLVLCEDPNGCTSATLTMFDNAVEQLGDVTVAGGRVYYDGNEGADDVVYSCPVGGCPSDASLGVEVLQDQPVGRIVTGPTDVLWTRFNADHGPYSMRCALPGCASNVPVRLGAETGPYSSLPSRELTLPATVVSVGVTSTLWATGGLSDDASKQLRACALATSCPTPTEIDTGGAPVSALTYFDGKHYGASPTDGGDVIFTVSDAAPAARTMIVPDAKGISDIAVDASGIYWVNRTTGTVRHCATPSGCTSGRILAAGQTGAHRIRLDDGFVYWATPTAVMRLAK